MVIPDIRRASVVVVGLEGEKVGDSGIPCDTVVEHGFESCDWEHELHALSGSRAKSVGQLEAFLENEDFRLGRGIHESEYEVVQEHAQLEWLGGSEHTVKKRTNKIYCTVFHNLIRALASRGKICV